MTKKNVGRKFDHQDQDFYEQVLVVVDNYVNAQKDHNYVQRFSTIVDKKYFGIAGTHL